MAKRKSEIKPIAEFRGRPLPLPAELAGYAALIDKHDLQLPLPTTLSAISAKSRPHSDTGWKVLGPTYKPDDTLGGHLEFALKWEGVDLGVLAALFHKVPDEEVMAFIQATPTGSYARRIWFLHEWLSGRKVGLPDASKVRAVPVIDPDIQFAVTNGVLSKRHRVINNLPGTREFCPLVRRTPKLKEYAAKHLEAQARSVVGRTHADVMARAAAFLLLSDSKSSFWIEGERPAAPRIARWGDAIGQAGTRSLSIAEFERLQRMLIEDARFVHLGLRTEGGFIGTHDRSTREPLPEHISARPQDLTNLLQGIVDYGAISVPGSIDPVVVAAAMAFGFVYVHPFEDGNGRLHRWLIHHILAKAGFNPPGVIFPVSAAMFREIATYRSVLESYSKPLLPYIQWSVTPKKNVSVLNDTADFYRYIDATAHAEFLYRCVEQTVEHDLPNEVAYLEAYDRFSQELQSIVDMPERTVDLLNRFLHQGNGRLSLRARKKEFAALTSSEIEEIETIHAECFANVKNVDGSLFPSDKTDEASD